MPRLTLLALAALALVFAASGSAAAPRCSRTVTTADSGRTIKLALHGCAILTLGGGLSWSKPKASNADVQVTSRSSQSFTLRAVHPGTATIASAGRPRCQAGRACALFIEAFSLKIRVA